jgi:hypothetical protein
MLCVVSVLIVNGQTQPTPVHAQTESQTPPAMAPPPSTANDSGWHFELTPYIWFAGTHGTVGVLGRDSSVHASAADLLSHFNFGILGAAEVRHNRFLLGGDLLWIRLSDSAALPFPGVSATSVDVRIGQLVWTSNIGYRLIDSKRFKADASVGLASGISGRN